MVLIIWLRLWKMSTSVGAGRGIGVMWGQWGILGEDGESGGECVLSINDGGGSRAWFIGKPWFGDR